MQLTTLNSRLAAASCALLGATLPAQASETERPWLVDTSVIVYSEADSRVQAVEPVVNLSRDFGDEHILNLRLTVDTLTGASPNGASATNRPQTFTGPSGNGAYTTPAGETPLDTSFKDTRAAFNASWSQPLGENRKIAVGGNFSTEYDFRSFGANINLSQDFNQHNSTLSAGLAVEYDLISPVGGPPQPGQRVIMGSGEGEEEGEDDDKQGEDSKNRQVIDALFGFTQVFSPTLVGQVNYSVGYSSGYHNDPYKLLSVVDGSSGETLSYVYESRPESRLRQSLFGQLKYVRGAHVLDGSYRYFLDDWGIRSHTFDFSWRWDFAGGRHYVQPHLRWYSQSAADFWHHSLVAGQDVTGLGNLPAGSYASADPRLGEFTATTFGLKYGYVPRRDHEFSIRLESYQQSGTDQPGDAIGVQRGLDLFPETSALLGQISYSFTF